MGWWTDIKNDASSIGSSIVNAPEAAWDNTGGALWELGKDTVDATGDVYNDMTGVTASREARDAQLDAADKAQAYQERQYGEAKGYMSPFANILGTGDDSILNQYKRDVMSSKYDPSSFEYGGQAPTYDYSGNVVKMGPYSGLQRSNIGHSGSQQFDTGYTGSQSANTGYSGMQASGVNYNGDMPQYGYNSNIADMNYTGNQNVGTISDFMSKMQEDPSYKFRMDQGLKAIDRAAAAGGRFGGGNTAREIIDYSQGLASQEYGNMWDRARQEQGISQAQEGTGYDRSLTGLGLDRSKEQTLRDRSIQDYNIGRDVEQTGYDRALTDTDMMNRAEQSQYDRAQTGLDRANMVEQSNRDRAMQDLNLKNLAEQSQYDRSLTQLDLRNQAEMEKRRRAEYDYESSRDVEAEEQRRAMEKYGVDTGREQTMRDRAFQEYSVNEAAKLEPLRRMQDLIDLGYSGSTALANQAVGLGGSLSDLALQRGDVTAAQKMSQPTFMDLLKDGASVYGELSKKR